MTQLRNPIFIGLPPHGARKPLPMLPTFPERPQLINWLGACTLSRSFFQISRIFPIPPDLQQAQ
jgi:hypothetical protein